MAKSSSNIVRTIMLETIDRGFDHRSWHGPNLMNALRGVHAKLAAKKVAGRKTIWQQLLHAAFWKRSVLMKLGGTFESPDHRWTNWPATPKADEKTWQADVRMLRDLHAALRKIVIAMPELKLRTDGDVRFRLEGVASHDVYHAAQIKLLRKFLRG